MVVIRPIASADLDQLMELATLTGFGLTTLPKDREFLRKRIAKSLRGFESLGEQISGETYLFVMEEVESKKVIGTCGIVSKVGGFEPFYAYRIERSIHESAALGIRKEIRTLHLVAEHNGPSEIGSLFLHPDYRKDGNGRLLSLSRFLFMAEHPDCFDATVLAELRGVIDEQGRSAFWDAVGKHFFDIDFPKADYLSIVNKRFIADLLPTHPIYTPLLPQAAQDVIGQVHEQSKPALKMLESEGFRFNGMVDIFEAGPVVTCPLKDIRTVRESQNVTIAGISDTGIESDPYLIANIKPDYRCVKGNVQFTPTGVRITADSARLLNVNAGDSVRLAAFRAAAVKEGGA